MNWRVLLILLVLCVGGAESRATSYALLVGVSEYSDPSLVDLEYAASDAREMAVALETQCGFARADILLLTEGDATRVRVAARAGGAVRPCVHLLRRARLDGRRS
jgi:hypothetical protein